MDKGYIKLHRDMFSNTGLSFSHKSTLLYLYLAQNANYKGSDKGKLRASINDLAYIIGESYHTTRTWLSLLCKTKLIDLQKDFKDSWLVIIRNYSRISGNGEGEINECTMDDNCTLNRCLDNEVISDSYKPLKKEERRIENKEKKKNNIKRKKEKFESRADAVAAIAGDQAKFVAYARSKSNDMDITTAWIEREFEKWRNWMDANNKSYSNYSKAFHNWILNAIQFQAERQPQRGRRLEDIPLLTADDYS